MWNDVTESTVDPLNGKFKPEFEFDRTFGLGRQRRRS